MGNSSTLIGQCELLSENLLRLEDKRGLMFRVEGDIYMKIGELYGTEDKIPSSWLSLKVR